MNMETRNASSSYVSNPQIYDKEIFQTNPNLYMQKLQDVLVFGKRKDRIKEENRQLKPFFSGLASFLIPGIGQIINFKMQKGIMHTLMFYSLIFYASLSSGVHPQLSMGLSLCAIAFRFISALDASKHVENE